MEILEIYMTSMFNEHVNQNNYLTVCSFHGIIVCHIAMYNLTILLFPSNIVEEISFSKFFGKVGIIPLSDFSISFEKITFYTEILTQKVELWIFSLGFTHEKKPQNNFPHQNSRARSFVT